MTTDISYTGLAVGLLLMAVPIFFLWKFRTGLVGATASSTVRMIVQLLLVGVYLHFLFEYNLWYVNLTWGLIMAGVATGTALQRIPLRKAVLALPIGVAFLATSLIISVYFLGLVLRQGYSLAELLNARYFIPIFGLLLGNMLGVNVVALTTYYDGLRRERQLYDYMLGNGATRAEATAPLIRQALQKAFSPCIANMAVMGLVAMPGTMIGQILGGSDPTTAIKYQMMIVVITFVASMLSLMIALKLAERRSFDRFGRLKDIFRD